MTEEDVPDNRIGIERWKAVRRQWLVKETENSEPVPLDAEELKQLRDILTDEELPIFPQSVPLDQMVETLEEIWDDKEGQCSICSLM
jgi:hypothetical protein